MDSDEEIVGPLPRDELMVMEWKVLGHAQSIATAVPLSHLSHLPYLSHQSYLPSSICSNAFCV